ncbi:hypothetical protein CW708_01860 [Candidatus Bathyarchaeota archaeon]|nr:MAG: hypothetical protein CW708_01860 [Candidatus Bathyarchaeota archaeon]
MELYEALIQKTEYKEHYDRVIAEAEKNPLLKKVIQNGIKEGLWSDDSQAIGKIHDSIVQAVYPAAISREIITVRTTSQPKERFIKRYATEAYVAAEGGGVNVIPAKTSYVDITCDIIIKAASEWTREMVEDATWNVMDYELQDLGKAVAVQETEKVLSVYDAIDASNLAGGSKLDGEAANLSWTMLLKLFNVIIGENYKPTVFAMNPIHAIQLLDDDKFVHSAYLPSESKIRNGVLTEIQPLNVKVVASTKITAGTVYAIDTDAAAVMLIRRDLTSEPYEDPKEGLYGIVASERIGIGIIQPKAVACMVNIGTTL